MKIAYLGDLSAWATSKANEYVEIGEKPASVYFELFCTDHKRHKYCNYSFNVVMSLYSIIDIYYSKS